MPEHATFVSAISGEDNALGHIPNQDHAEQIEKPGVDSPRRLWNPKADQSDYIEEYGSRPSLYFLPTIATIIVIVH